METHEEGEGATKPRKETCLGCREYGRGERRRFPRVGRVEDGGTGDRLGGNSRSRAEKQEERAQEETRGKGDCTEKESQKTTWGAQGSGPRAVLEAVHIHTVDVVFLEFVEQFRDAPIFAVTRVYGTL